MARPIRVRPKPHSTMPVAIVDRPSVISTGASSGADGSAAVMRSTSEAARIAVTAAVELSGPAIAKGSELPSPMHGGKHGRGDEGRGDAVGQIGRQRAGEDQQRVGQAEGDGQNAGGAAAEYIS